jgi:hypothetical protein
VPPFDEPFDDRPEVLSTLRVESRRRFVEEEDRRIGDERRGQVQTTSHATGVGRRQLVREVGQAEVNEQLTRTSNRRGPLHVIEKAHHSEVLESGEVLIDRGELARETDRASYVTGLLHDVVARDDGTAFGRRERPWRGCAPSSSCPSRWVRGVRRPVRSAPATRRRRGLESSPSLNVRTMSVASTENSDMGESLGRHRYTPDVGARENRYLLPMAISESEIAQVRSATDIVALISETVALKKSGRRWTGLCPFHGEKTPSFSVNAEEGRYYCFGCRASGDQITFVREIQHLDFMDALRQLADRAGIELHDDANAGPGPKGTSRGDGGDGQGGHVVPRTTAQCSGRATRA